MEGINLKWLSIYDLNLLAEKIIDELSTRSEEESFEVKSRFGQLIEQYTQEDLLRDISLDIE